MPCRRLSRFSARKMDNPCPARGLSGSAVVVPILEGKMIRQRTNSQRNFVRKLRTRSALGPCVSSQSQFEVNRRQKAELLPGCFPPACSAHSISRPDEARRAHRSCGTCSPAQPSLEEGGSSLTD